MTSVQSLGFRIQGLGGRVQRVEVAGIWVWDLELRAHD